MILVVISIALTVGAVELSAVVYNRMYFDPIVFTSEDYKNIPSKFEIVSTLENKKHFPWRKPTYEKLAVLTWPLHNQTDDVATLEPSASAMFERRNERGDKKLTYLVNTDEKGRRRTSRTSGKNHLFVMGCSYTFGEGINEADTLPQLLQSQLKNYQVYNLGYSGYTIDDIYYRSKTQGFMDAVPQRDGVAIYVMMGDHVARSFGAMRDEWRMKKIKLEEESNFNFVSRGSYFEDLKGFNWIPYYIANSEFAVMMNMDLPLITESKVELFVRKIKATALLHEEKFKSSAGEKSDTRFYVVLYPDYFDKHTRTWVRKYLDKYEIPFIDYSGLDISRWTEAEVRLIDGHPNRASNLLLSAQIAEDLSLN